MKYINQLIQKYVKPWFFSVNDPERIKVPYVISFLFILLMVTSIVAYLSFKLWQFDMIRKLWAKEGTEGLQAMTELSKLDITLIPLITVLVSSAGLFIGLYNWGKKKGNVIPSSTVAFKGTGKDDGTISDKEI